MECYLAPHRLVNWSSQLAAWILREQLSSFDPCHYSLPLIRIVVAGHQPAADHILDPFEIFGSMVGWLDGSMVPWFDRHL